MMPNNIHMVDNDLPNFFKVIDFSSSANSNIISFMINFDDDNSNLNNCSIPTPIDVNVSEVLNHAKKVLSLAS